MGEISATKGSTSVFSFEASLSRQLFGEVANLRKIVEACLANADPASVHALRVTSRHIRSLFFSYRPILKKDPRQSGEHQLRMLSERFADLNNIDAFTNQINAHLPDIHLEEISIAQSLLDTLSRDRKTLADEVTCANSKNEIDLILEELEKFALNPLIKKPVARLSNKDKRKLLNRCIRETWSTLATEITEISRKSTVEDLHQIRISAKYCRYVHALAFKYELVETRNRGVEHYAKGIQQVLGAYLDAIHLNDWINTQTYLPPEERGMARAWIAADLEFNFRELKKSK